MPEPFIGNQTSSTRTVDSVQLVQVVDIKIKFWSLVGLFVKAAIAAIPAFIILFALGLLFIVTSAFWLGILNGITAK